MTDLEQIRSMVRLVAKDGSPARIVSVIHEGEPVPKERPRFGRGHAYSASKTEGRERALAVRIRAALDGRQFTGNVAVACIFYRSTRRRVDADNLTKLVLDAATLAGAWRDDCQVTAQASWVELDADNPRTVFALCDTAGSLDRTADRKRKGKPAAATEGEG